MRGEREGGGQGGCRHIEQIVFASEEYMSVARKFLPINAEETTSMERARQQAEKNATE